MDQFDQALRNKNPLAVAEAISQWVEMAPTSAFPSLIQKLAAFNKADIKIEADVERKLFLRAQEIIAKKWIVPMLSAASFEFDVFEILSSIRNASCVPAGMIEFVKLEKLILPAYQKENIPINRLVLASMLFTCGIYQGKVESAKSEYLSRLMELDVYQIFSSEQNLKDFSGNFLKVFPALGEVLKILSDNIFNKKFNNLDILQQKIKVMWVLAVFWVIYSDQHSLCQIIAPLWLNIFNSAIKRNDTELALFMYLPLSHLRLVLYQAKEHKKRFVEDVEKPLSKYLQSLSQKLSLIPSGKPDPAKKKFRVGILVDRLVMVSPTKILLSLLKSLKLYPQAQFEIIIYDLEIIDAGKSNPEVVEQVTSMGYRCINIHLLLQGNQGDYYYSRLEKCLKLREQIKSDDIDILISSSYHLQTNFLFSSRTASVQIYWSHGNYAYDVANIDFRVLHGAPTLRMSQCEGFSYREFSPGMDAAFYYGKAQADHIKQIKASLPAHQFVLGAIGNIKKLNNKHYLFAVSEILRRCPQTIFLACGAGNYQGHGPYEEIKLFFESQGILDRVVFTGLIDPDIYGHVIDMMLVSFPVYQGEALAEFQSKGGLYLSLLSGMYETDSFLAKEPDKKKLPTTFARVTVDNLRRVVAFSLNDYISVAEYLVKSILPLPKSEYNIDEYYWRINYIRDQLDQQKASLHFSVLMKEMLGETDISKPDQVLDDKKNSQVDISIDALIFGLKQHLSGKGKVTVTGFDFLDADTSKFNNAFAQQLVQRLVAEGFDVAVSDMVLSAECVEHIFKTSFRPEFIDEDIVIMIAQDKLVYENQLKIVGSGNLKSGQIIVDIYGVWQAETELFKKMKIKYLQLEEIISASCCVRQD